MKLVTLFENELSLSTVKEFNNQIKRNPLKDYYGKARDSIKTSTVVNIEYGHISYYMDPIFDLCQITNIDTLGYNIYPPTRYNYLNYNIYNQGDEYSWHSDGTDTEHNYDQKYTVLINLSEQSYTGGEFEIFDNGIKEIKNFKSGSILMFTSHIQHRVKPILSGERITLTYWMIGPKFR